jgi:hypothetical protein
VEAAGAILWTTESPDGLLFWGRNYAESNINEMQATEALR